MQGAGAVGLVALVALATVILAGNQSDTAYSTIRIDLPVEPGSTIRVNLKNSEGSVSGVTDASGTVTFDDDIVAGTYDVFVTVESPPAAPTAADIGTAITAYQALDVTLEAGVNTLDTNTLTPKLP